MTPIKLKGYTAHALLRCNTSEPLVNPKPWALDLGAPGSSALCSFLTNFVPIVPHCCNRKGCTTSFPVVQLSTTRAAGDFRLLARGEVLATNYFPKSP